MAHELSAGSVFAGYRIERMLGAGGMGTVYLARNPDLPRSEALKVLAAELSRDLDFRARFVREADVAAGLDHPNIVAVHQRGQFEGRLWIAMQFVDGGGRRGRHRGDHDIAPTADRDAAKRCSPFSHLVQHNTTATTDRDKVAPTRVVAAP